MKIKSIKLTKFRRFERLEISDLPQARLIILAGPNGSGKSSLFDAFALWRGARALGLDWRKSYHDRGALNMQWNQQVDIEFHTQPNPATAFYLRTAYRNEPEFVLQGFTRQESPAQEQRFSRMNQGDSAVSGNYQRLAANALEDLFSKEPGSTTIEAFREKVIGQLRHSMLRLFPDLSLNTLGNPLEDGTFRFDKGTMKSFSYENLSGGEKAAFDLILDLVVKQSTFSDSVYAIDEPEAHVNPRLQGKLLEELVRLIPSGSQLWVATHSIGMMRKARELYDQNPGDVVFLDFEDKDFDQPAFLAPQEPNRAFWERTLRVALDDLADLVSPREIVICEGNPVAAVASKNDEHDARCYAVIFGDNHPDVSFVSAGSSKEVEGDRLKFAATFPRVVKGISVRRIIDRDDHASTDIADFKKKGLRVLSRRHIESYLYDEEVLEALYEKHGRAADFGAAQTARNDALAGSVGRGNPTDDIKSAAQTISAFLRRDLALTQSGNDQPAFARNVLAPLVRPGMQVYAELDEDIFGS